MRRNLGTIWSVGEVYAKWNCYPFVTFSAALKLVWKNLFGLAEQPSCVQKNRYIPVRFSVKKKKKKTEAWRSLLTLPIGITG